MKKVLLIWAMLICPVTDAHQEQAMATKSDAPAVIGDYRASYQLFRSGTPRGMAQRQILRGADSTYTLTMKAQASMFFYSIQTCEKSHFSVLEGSLAPLTYDKIDQRSFKDKKVVHLEFDHSNALMSGSIGKEQWKNSFSGEVFDPLLVVEQLRLVAQNGEHKDVQFSVYGDQQLAHYSFVYQGLEKVNTSVGTFSAVKYTRVRPNSSRRTSFWLAIDKQFIPVKVLQEKDGEEQATLILASPITTSEKPNSQQHKWKITC